MHIFWHGISCVKIQTHDAVFIFNPYSDSVGITMPKLKAEVVVTTNPANEQSNNIERLQGEPFVISGAGEYEVKGMHIHGMEYADGSVFYITKSEGITVAHLGTLNMPLTDEHLEALEGVDILLLPLACAEGVTPDKVVANIEPRIVIPIAYKTSKVKIALPEFDAFAKDMGLKDTTPEEKLLIKFKDLPQEETVIKVLQAV